MFFFKTMLVVICVFFNLHAKDNKTSLLPNINEVYFLPKEADIAKDNILRLIKKSKNNISIAMYNFSYKKFAKELISSSKDGVEVTIILDKSKITKNDKIYKYLKSNGINIKIADKKMHMKIAIFDEKIAVLGSINWTKESFKDNYEVVLFTKDKKTINKMLNYLNRF
ncbi:phospholipase D-like domain-containing protein [Poseidonibacter antarcticus]|uniref:phospholipase D-like domain-containing protein n=1 Tax=Poseidonibacter antarcticus TaxID=2478538 RepID=UPI001D1910CE|nr:phospholipase D-like domain-containing protein [Poseidonibacter antarcticus]